jgi:ArsR family transcriptional regulator
MMKCCPKDESIRKEWIESLQKELNEEKGRIAETSNLCKAFSHPLRIRIALLLSKSDLCVSEIASILGEEQNLISHHLSLMRKSRVIESYSHSIYRYYTLRRDAADFLSVLLNSSAKG